MEREGHWMATAELLFGVGSISEKRMLGKGAIETFSFEEVDAEAIGLWLEEGGCVRISLTNRMYNLPTPEADRLDLFGDKWGVLNPDSTATARAVVVATETKNQQKVR